MEVFVQHRREAMTFFIYVLLGEDREKRTKTFLTADRQAFETPVGSEAPAYLAIPDDIFEAVIREGRKEFPPETSDVRDHLADSIQVRDRALALVERLVIPAVIAER